MNIDEIPTPETDAFMLEYNRAIAAQKTRPSMWDKLQSLERGRDEWRAIAEEALASFRCTQKPEDYPEGHWSRRAQTLLKH